MQVHEWNDSSTNASHAAIELDNLLIDRSDLKFDSLKWIEDWLTENVYDQLIGKKVEVCRAMQRCGLFDANESSAEKVVEEACKIRNQFLAIRTYPEFFCKYLRNDLEKFREFCLELSRSLVAER